MVIASVHLLIESHMQQRWKMFFALSAIAACMTWHLLAFSQGIERPIVSLDVRVAIVAQALLLDRVQALADTPGGPETQSVNEVLQFARTLQNYTQVVMNHGDDPALISSAQVNLQVSARNLANSSGTGTGAISSTPGVVVYELANEIAACKINCSSLGVPDCEDEEEREIEILKIRNVARLLIKGRASAEASTSYSNGSITAKFESTDGAMSEHGKAVIQARSSQNFTINMPLSKKQNGSLTLYLHVSDWCTAVSKLTVYAFTDIDR